MDHGSGTKDLSVLTDLWLSRYKPTTQQTYGFHLPKWLAWCEQKGVGPLAATRAHIELWLRSIVATGKAPATVAVHFDAVSSFYKFLYEEEYLERNPCARVTRPKIHYELQRREVLTVLGKGDKPARVPAAILFRAIVIEVLQAKI